MRILKKQLVNVMDVVKNAFKSLSKHWFRVFCGFTAQIPVTVFPGKQALAGQLKDAGHIRVVGNLDQYT